ncbi:unnamed protein product [Protopolystoma xenopodis]|uniref:Conserved oligomeric Golgi complex subunit 8 n=1 Tax=Protopolystoma xenopodis TaxID=117903 RepID=A0A448WMR0_9PLAT|nr:unnamed protein product [Protopolystoma xenopodis]
MEGDSESSQVLLDQYMGLNSLAEFIVKKRNLPENTVHEPAFLESLSSLSKQSLNLLSSSLSQFKTKRDSLNRKIEDFSSTNYSVFLNKAEANKAVLDGCEVIKSSNDLLLSKVPDLASSVEVFMQNSFDLIRNSKLNMIALRKHTQILELLELPQLIETFLLNGYFDDALLIYAHAEKIKKKQTGRSPLIHLIANQVQRVGNQLLSYLCRQLSMPISLSSCLKTIVYLRRMNIFNEQELRLKFLQARSICLNDRLTAALYQNTYSPQLDFERPRSSSTNINCDKSNSGDIVELNEFKNGQSNFLDSSSSKSFIKTDRAHYEVYFRATHRIEVTRLQLFDIVTQYRAVFADDEGLLAGHISDKNCSTPPLSIWHPLFVDYSPSSHLYPVSESLFLPSTSMFIARFYRTFVDVSAN